MKIAVLALQGDFAEHEAVFRALGCETFQIRQKKDLDQPADALILPGGESTVQGKLLRELVAHLVRAAQKDKENTGVSVFADLDPQD